MNINKKLLQDYMNEDPNSEWGSDVKVISYALLEEQAGVTVTFSNIHISKSNPEETELCIFDLISFVYSKLN